MSRDGGKKRGNMRKTKKSSSSSAAEKSKSRSHQNINITKRPGGVVLGAKYTRLITVYERAVKQIFAEVPESCFFDAHVQGDIGVDYDSDTEDRQKAFARRIREEFATEVTENSVAEYKKMVASTDLKRRFRELEAKVIASKQPRSLASGKDRVATITDATPGTAMTQLAINNKLRVREKIKGEIAKLDNRSSVALAERRAHLTELERLIAELKAEGEAIEEPV